MAWVWPALAAGTAIYSAVSANKSRKQTNEQEVELANTAVTRRMADLKRAGINPALAYTNASAGASTPNLESYNYEPIASAGREVNDAYTSSFARTNMKMQNGLLAAQTAASAAQARLTNAEASIREAAVPYGAGDAQRRSQMLDIEMQQLAAATSSAISKADIDWNAKQMSDLSLAQQRAIQPLLLEYQELLNQGEKLGLSQKEVDAKFAESLGEENKFLTFLHNIFRLGSK